MIPSITRSDLPYKRILTGLAAAAFWLAVWQGIAMLVAQELLVPAPLVVLKTLFRLLSSPLFWQATGFSLLRVVSGFLAALVVGCAAALLTTRFSIARILLSPLLKIIRAAPVASFIILALVWVQTNWLPGFIAFLMVVPVVWNNLENGIRSIDGNLLEMAKVFHMGWIKTLIRVRIPAVMPYFLAACTTGLGFAWKSGIAAEIICRPALSIGRQLQDAKVYLETAEVFAWTAVAVALSILLEKGLLFLARRLGRRFNTGE